MTTGPAVRNRTARARLRDVPFARAVGAYLAVRLVVLGVVALADLATHHGLVGDLSTWDGAWFLRAVNHGWPRHLPIADGHVAANPIAFFPLLVVVIRALDAVTGLSGGVVGLAVSGLSGLGAVLGVGYLTRTFSDATRAERAALLFALSPGSFVFSLIYAEGLLLSAVTWGLWALARRRWWLAGVLGALASAASPLGLAFAAAAAAAALAEWRRARDPRALVAPALAPVGFAAWMVFLRMHTGTWNAWRLTEAGGWRSGFSPLYPWRIVWRFVSNPLSPTMTGQILFAGTVVTVVALVIAFREHQPAAVLTYASAAVFLAAFAAPVGLRPRMVMVAFPLTIALATRWSGWRFRALVVVSTVALALMAIETLTSWAVFP
ncbi:MAG: mannosyltransferase family protein [Acidimicrobiales bacterium]